MRIALLQMDLAWNRPAENIRHADALASAQPCDLYVLPEMWATGFVVEPEGVVDDENRSEALAWMRRFAHEHQCALSGSLAVRVADGSYRNRHYFVTPDSCIFYDKHHLFTHGGEHRRYTAGQQAVVAEWQGCRFMLQTCYDLRFPVFARYGRAGNTYDVLVYVASWPASRQLAWDTLIRARAIENQCYVLAVNREGSDPQTSYQGGSAIVDPLGRTVGESCCVVDVDLQELPLLRSRFRVLDDRDEC
ncbi:MAG: nitrilase family protein [Prevotella sp.]|nr:nitrilase family protein [Prevotella sp.]